MAMQSSPSAWRALRIKDFRLLAFAFTVDAVGGWAYNVVLVIYVFERTGSPGWIAATTASSWIPRLIASSFAGVLADRYERTRVMIASALTSFCVMAALTLAVALDVPVLVVLGLSAVAAVTTTPYRPAASGLLPDVVTETDLVAANAVFGTLESLVVVVGPALGGLLLLAGQPAYGVGINALSFLVAAAIVRGLTTRSRAEQPEEPDSLVNAVVEGVRALRSEPVALVLVLFCALDSAVFGASTVLYVPISQHVGAGSNGYSYLLAASALGGVLLASLVNRISASASLLAPILVGMAALSLPTAATAFVSSAPAALALQVVAGGGMVMVDVLAITALQRDLPKHVLGRVFGMLDTAVLAAIVSASVLTSQLLRNASLHVTLLVVGLGFAGLTVLGVPALLRADRRLAQVVALLAPRVALLRELDLLAAAPQAVLEQLAKSLEERRLEAGTVLIRQGDPPDALWVVVEGTVTVTVTAVSGQTNVLGTQGPSTYVGEIGLLHGTRRSATVTTSASSLLWRISAADFSQALEDSAASPALLGVVGRRLARSQATGPGPAQLPA